MRQWAGKRYWLIGASDGLGAALARIMGASGAELVLSARSADKLAELARDLPGSAQVLPLDVSDAASVRAAAQKVGRVDGVVFMAGLYWPMTAADWRPDEAEAMADVNFTGLVRVLGTVVPDMVSRDAGHIVITGSLSGFRGLPGAIGYSASKAAVMSLAECLYADLRRTGVRVQLINPGFIKTRLTAKNDFAMPFIMAPEKAAQIMFAHMSGRGFKHSFPRLFSWMFRGSQFLPDWFYYRLFA